MIREDPKFHHRFIEKKDYLWFHKPLVLSWLWVILRFRLCPIFEVYKMKTNMLLCLHKYNASSTLSHNSTKFSRLLLSNNHDITSCIISASPQIKSPQIPSNMNVCSKIQIIPYLALEFIIKN